MIESFVQSWEKHKDELKKYIKTHPQAEYGESYEDLVKLLFNMVINPDTKPRQEYLTEHLHEIDDNSYQGTLIFVLYRTTYPSVYDYVYTSVEYGSCSICDTLLGIQSNNMEELPDENQVDGYMQLLLNLLQNCHLMKGEE